MLEASYIFGAVSYNLTALLSIMIINYHLKIKNGQRRLFILFFCVICFSIMTLGNAMTNDFFPYKEIVKTIVSTKDPFVSVEPFWVKTIQYFHLSHQSYLFLIAFLSFVCLCVTVNILKPRNLALFLALWFVLCFSGAIAGRAILFYMSFYLGVAMLGIKKYSAGISIIIISLFLHKFAYIAVVIFLFSLVPISRRRMMQILASACIVSLVVRGLLMTNIQEIYTIMSGAGIPGTTYLLEEENRNATGMFLWTILSEANYFIPLTFISIVLYRCSSMTEVLNSLERKFFFLAFWSLVISLSLKCINLPDPTMCGRTLYFAYLPTIYLYCSVCHGVRIKTSSHKWLVCLSVLSLICSNISIMRVAMINHIF